MDWVEWLVVVFAVGCVWEIWRSSRRIESRLLSVQNYLMSVDRRLEELPLLIDYEILGQIKRNTEDVISDISAIKNNLEEDVKNLAQKIDGLNISFELEVALEKHKNDLVLETFTVKHEIPRDLDNF